MRVHKWKTLILLARPLTHNFYQKGAVTAHACITLFRLKAFSESHFVINPSSQSAAWHQIGWSIHPQSSGLGKHSLTHGERNSHRFGARLPLAKISSITPRHRKRGNEARRCQKEQLSHIFRYWRQHQALWLCGIKEELRKHVAEIDMCNYNLGTSLSDFNPV